MTFLGHVLSDEGVEVDPRKTEAVKNRKKSSYSDRYLLLPLLPH